MNAGLGEDTATFDRSTVDAVDDAAPWTAAAAIPSGLDPATEQAVLVVYSDLVSRFGALRGGDCLQVGTVPRASLNADCFVRGHEAKVRTPENIRAAQAAAASSIDPPDPAARAAAEVQVRIESSTRPISAAGRWADSSPPTPSPSSGPANRPAIRRCHPPTGPSAASDSRSRTASPALDGEPAGVLILPARLTSPSCRRADFATAGGSG